MKLRCEKESARLILEHCASKKGEVKPSLKYLDVSKICLAGSDLSGADLSGSSFSKSDLREVNLSSTNLTACRFGFCDMTSANLQYSNLSHAYFPHSSLVKADFTGAILYTTWLNSANLNQAKGLMSSSDFIKRLERDEKGVISYKTFNNTKHGIPDSWKIEPGSFIEENVCYCKANPCSHGINLGPYEFSMLYTGELWKVRIHWEYLPDIVVPYGTTGCFRAGRVELIEVVDRRKKQ